MTSSPTAPSGPQTSVDPAEIEKFSRLASEWWDPQSKFKPLHKFNPVRLAYIKQQVCDHYGLDPRAPAPFKGLRFLDIGCGGGLLCEPMARLGAEVVGVDPGHVNVEVAKLHAESSGLEIDYRQSTAEDLQAAGETFDVVLNMEVVEHVADVPSFMAACAAMVRPGGLMFVATINRTPKAYALAIVGAEYVLRWLPRGTHQYDKLVKPDEIRGAFSTAGLAIADETGVSYNPLADRWGLSADMDVNYMMLGARPKG
jgi:2-polyprenyl-6-hydroxyphenyl methylase/3-demethylubiquinone-9 3-methyltransferase